MKVRDVMHANPLTVRPTDNVGLAAQLMAWEEIRHLPVVDGDRVVGFLSERDLLARKPEVGGTGLLSEIISGPVQSVFPDDELTEVAERLVASKREGFPVIERGKLVGVITTTDILGQRYQRSVEPSEKSISGIMTPNPETAAMDDLLLDAVGRMTQRGIRHLPVVDGDHRVLGMLSDRDVRSTIGGLLTADDIEPRQLSRRVEALRVSDVVRRSPITLPESATVASLIRVLVDRRVGAVPVVDEDDRLVGIVSYLDVLSRGLGVTPDAASPRATNEARPHV